MFGSIVGGLLGGVTGAMKKKPAAYDMDKYGLGALWDADQSKSYGKDFMGTMRGLAQQQPGLSMGEMGQMTGAGRSHIAQQNRRALAQLQEGALASGMGPRGGALGQNILAANRQALDAQRGLAGDAMNAALQVRGQDKDRQLSAASAGQNALQQELQRQAVQAKLAFFGIDGAGGQMARANAPSRMQNIIGGAARGFFGGGGGLF